MANENIFTAKADSYLIGRPSYSPYAIDKIFSEMISCGKSAADIGSGTGILSKEFLIRGYDVFSVEPNAAMRTIAEKAYGAHKNFHSVAASAENTGLGDGSISLVTAASSFHWFDVNKFYDECKRILTFDGIVCILANERVYDSFTQKQHSVCQKYCNGFTSLSHGTKKILQNADIFFKSKYAIEKFDFPLTYTKEKFIFRSLSSSYSPEKGSCKYYEYIKELQALLDRTFIGDTVTIANNTVMLWGKLN